MSKSGQKLLETGSIHGMVAGACALPLTARCVRPQNDLQAQARAHRLGQLKTVMIFRCAAAGHARGALQTRGAHRLWFAPALLQGTHVRSGAPHQRFWVHWFRCCHRPAPSATSVAAADGQPGESRPPASHAMRPARLVTHNTVEERMLAVSRRKLVLERVVVQTNDASLRQARRPPPPPPATPPAPAQHAALALAGACHGQRFPPCAVRWRAASQGETPAAVPHSSACWTARTEARPWPRRASWTTCCATARPSSSPRNAPTRPPQRVRPHRRRAAPLAAACAPALHGKNGSWWECRQARCCAHWRAWHALGSWLAEREQRETSSVRGPACRALGEAGEGWALAG